MLLRTVVPVVLLIFWVGYGFLAAAYRSFVLVEQIDRGPGVLILALVELGFGAGFLVVAFSLCSYLWQRERRSQESQRAMEELDRRLRESAGTVSAPAPLAPPNPEARAMLDQWVSESLPPAEGPPAG
jgi:hypothetical protein